MRQQSVIRVLIADDHELVRRGLTMVLEMEEGLCVVGEARTGREAIEVTVQERPDVLLLDLKMPDIDGIHVLKAVKRRAPFTKVLILTGFEVDEAILRAVQEGTDGFVFKDIPPQELYRAIRLVATGEVYMQPAVTRRLMQLMARKTTEEVPLKGSSLTPREVEVLRLMARGYSNQEIADLTSLSLETVRSHVKNILQKLDQPNRTRAVLYALRSGLVTMNEISG
ncbi:MAG: response regulator transcription factor [Armatimonadota bacterium]|nr:response regulator transcription factor [Armatimonadota bacterium]